MTKPVNPDYHWTPEAMRTFLEALAETGLVGEACDAAGKSRRAAYNMRFRTEGRAFALGWEAALLVARVTLHDTLMERAIAGYTVTTVRDPETHTSTTERIDNKCGTALLHRLDRMTGIGAAPEAGSDAALARIVSQDFWRFLDLVEAGGQGSEAALFVAARTPADPAERCELADEDVENDEDCDLADQGFESFEDILAHAERKAEELTVWFCQKEKRRVTDFPPPPGFEGKQAGAFGSYDYFRHLTDAEDAIQERIEIEDRAPYLHAAEAARDRWFALADEVANDAGDAELAA